MKDNKLIEIPLCDWINVRDLYKDNWPKNCWGYYTLDNFIRWRENSTIKTIKVLSLNGDWSDGTYFIIDRMHVYVSTLNNDHQRILDGLNCLDLPHAIVIFGFPQKYKPIIQKFFELRGQGSTIDTTVWLQIKREDALKFQVEPPAGVTLMQLKEEHAPIVNEIWPHRYPGSLEFVKRLINLNESVGAFNEKGELMAWVLRLPTGCLGVLHVKDKYKRQGLGSLMVKALSKQLAEQGNEIFAPVVVANIPSRNMFEKLGFQQIDEVYWQMGKLNANSVIWTDEMDNE